MYELYFAGEGDANRGFPRYKFPRYRRLHRTIESAEAEAEKVFGKLRERQLPTACHDAQIEKVR